MAVLKPRKSHISRNIREATEFLSRENLNNTQLVILKRQSTRNTLTTNIWKEAGLTNGAKGIVKYIVYEPRIKPKALPSIVIVQFPQYVGPSYQKTISKCAPITPIKRSWFSGKTQCWRRMLPLKPAYGTTIHSSQGQSLDRVIINIGKKEFSNGLTYTAISRCKKIEMLAFKPMESCKRFTSIFQANVFKYRQIQDEKEKQADQNFDDE